MTLPTTSQREIKRFPIMAKVIGNVRLSDDIYEISLHCSQIAGKSVPGQFVSVLCRDLILRRPFSIAYADNDNFKIIYKLKGQGTKYISSLKSDDEIDLIGPLGNGFNITDDKSLLLGAGVGIAPIIYLASVLQEREISYAVLAGFQKLMPIPHLNSDKAVIITEDNSSGYKGRVTDYLKDIIKQHMPQKIYACGPEIVLKQTVDIARQFNVPVEVALEKKFACGVGACMGCNIQIKENKQIKNRRICKDGPVFIGESVIW
jgi:dihydroorotate dehydrogenase electron transfer subunit